MNVYIVFNMPDPWEGADIESVFAERGAAEAYIDEMLTAQHADAVDLAARRNVVAERWVGAGGGLVRPVQEPGPLDTWLQRGGREWKIEEHEVR